MELALYAPEVGFYEGGGGAGRRHDFLTSPEVGPLFGAVLARALDAWWDELGRPEGFTVVDAGAGRGTLARAILAAEPACAAALRYVAVERSASLRSQHPAGIDSRADLPTGRFVGVVLANELLDNLPWKLFQRTELGWAEVRVEAEVRVDDGLREVPVVPAEGEPAEAALAPDAPVGARIPAQRAAAAWVRRACASVEAGRVVVIDYADVTASLARRPWTDWVRTYRGHGRGGHPLADLGLQDVTCEVAVDQLPAATTNRSQAELLAAFGLDDLAAEARRAWQERAHIGDLEALRARSRAQEAVALADPAGLGAFRVLEWVCPPPPAQGV